MYIYIHAHTYCLGSFFFPPKRVRGGPKNGAIEVMKEMAIPAELAIGSCVFFSGTLWPLAKTGGGFTTDQGYQGHRD